MPLVSIVSDQPEQRMASSLIGRLTYNWRARGIKVHYGQSFAADADIGILHLDRTVVADADVPPVPQGLAVMNLGVRDISKRRYSTLLLTPGSAWDGPVIIKTDRNHFGLPEGAGTAAVWLRRLRVALYGDWKRAGVLPHKTYPVLPSLRDVPDWVWQDRALIVERFIPERENGRFALRGAVFFGRRHYAFRLFSSDPLVKTGSMTGHEFLPEADPDVQAFWQREKFDFGKIDYVMHDGKAVILDANKTPVIKSPPDTPRLVRLADGLEELIG